MDKKDILNLLNKIGTYIENCQYDDAWTTICDAIISLKEV